MLVLPEPLRPTITPTCQSSPSIGKEPLKCFSNLTSDSVKLPTTLCALKLSAWSQRFTTPKSVAYNPPVSASQRYVSVRLQANFNALFTINITPVFIGYYRVCPAVFLQAAPNLLLLLNSGTIWVLL